MPEPSRWRRFLYRAGARLYRWARMKPDHASLGRFSDAEHEAIFRRDLGDLRIWIRGLERVTRRAESLPALFARRTKSRLNFDQRARLRGLWASFLDYLMAIDGLKFFHAGFPALDFEARRLPHARSYLLAYAGFLAQYHAGLRFLRLTMGKRALETLLDEAAPELGLPAGRYAELKWNVIHVADVTKVLVGEAYFDLFRPLFPRGSEAAPLVAYVRRALPAVKRHLARRALKYFAAQMMALLKRGVFATWFPLQRRVALLGLRRLRDHTPLVTPQRAASLGERLRPGDILVERRSWRLSNVGLPGFWPHAALYVGRPADLGRAFGPAFPRRLRRKFPAAFARYASGSFRVIESMAPGVVLNTLEESAHADFVGALRPRRGTREAVERAFHYHGRPYDFDFDFTSDASLVCSELVYKCYEGALSLPLVSTAGRLVLPVNEIVRKFDRECDTPRQELDFVAFLDGARDGSLADLRKSHLRPKWDFLQK